MISFGKKTMVPGCMIVFLALLPFKTWSEGSDRLIRNWNYTCEGNGACQAFLGIRIADESVVAWSIQKSQKTGEVTSIIRVPLGVILQAGVRVYTADDAFFSLDYRICLPDGCSASVVLDDAIRKQLGSVDTVRVVYFTQAPGEEAKSLSFGLSVKGVTEVFEALDRGAN